MSDEDIEKQFELWKKEVELNYEKWLLGLKKKFPEGWSEE